MMVGRDFESSMKIRELTPFDHDFPERLRQIPGCPSVIYVRGELPAEDVPTVGIIGARDATLYGLDTARTFGQILARQGVQVISGMAYGIDSAGQRGAVDAEGKTFAVFGCGLDICYPETNYDLYEKLLKYHGGAITEHPLGTKPLGRHFASRNRIIAGLSDILLVMEAKERSGTFITVGYALDQGKEVYALPGRITDRLSEGCNALIRQGAGILTSPEDVFTALRLKYEKKETVSGPDPAKLSPLGRKVYDTLSEDAVHQDEIIGRVHLSIQRVTEILLELEMLGFAESPKFGYYRIRHKQS